ncbi:MAG: hypothetical protein O4859_30645, partial [Trichodesmium sp. St18_bin1]|nr:hypothetical protein [Trichodesmium sp. St18_bin1]
SGLEVYREADWKSIAKRTGSLSRSGLEVYREADWKSIAKRTGSLSLQRKIIDLQGIKSNLAS